MDFLTNEKFKNLDALHQRMILLMALWIVFKESGASCKENQILCADLIYPQKNRSFYLNAVSELLKQQSRASARRYEKIVMFFLKIEGEWLDSVYYEYSPALTAVMMEVMRSAYFTASELRELFCIPLEGGKQRVIIPSFFGKELEGRFFSLDSLYKNIEWSLLKKSEFKYSKGCALLEALNKLMGEPYPSQDSRLLAELLLEETKLYVS